MKAQRFHAWGIVFALLLTACNTTPNVPEQVTVTVTDYRPLPEWIQPVPIHQRSDSTVRAHLTAECRHKLDQAVANCRISAARRIVAGQGVEPAECALQIACEDP